MLYINFYKPARGGLWKYLGTTSRKKTDAELAEYKKNNIEFAEVCMTYDTKILPVIKDFVEDGGWNILDMPGYVQMRCA